MPAIAYVLPYLFHIGHLSLPTFGALAAAGLMLALWLSQRTARLAGVDPQRLWDAGVFSILTAFALSRVLLVATHWTSFAAYPLLLLTVPSLTAPGLLLTALTVAVWLRWRQMSLRRTLDAWAPCGALVWAFLALGHLAEGSDPGMANGWGVRMPGENGRTHPVALYAAAIALLLTWVAMRRMRRPHGAGTVAALTLGIAGVSQFLLSFVRLPGDAPGGLDPLQWAALGMVAAGAGLWPGWRR